MHRDLLRLAPFALCCLALCCLALGAPGAMADSPMPMPASVPAASAALAGAWELVRVDNVYPDGRRIELYSPHPQGLWLIDAQGHYMMQIVCAQRAPFAAGEKSKGTPEEYRAAALDFNAHYGTVRAGADGHLHTHIDHASFPNWDGRDGDEPYTLKGEELSYLVAKPSSGASEGAHGEVVWRRLR
jgi:hypothetical protein